jgi:hypothetical protein
MRLLGFHQFQTRPRLISGNTFLPEALTTAAPTGFPTIGSESNPELGFTIHLGVPNGLIARDGLQRLRQVAPDIQADDDQVFEPAGGALVPVAGSLPSAAGAGGIRIGIIDGGVASHPSLVGASVEQHGFSGQPEATGHGTAVASLVAGNQRPFHGAARGASLLVADVYGGNRAAGSASAIARALGWLASKRPRVINISLVGPQNAPVRLARRCTSKQCPRHYSLIFHT